MKLYKFVTGFVALGLAACAAYFSVIGIATFLGGRFWQVAIMASFLEAGKLVCASAAYRFRNLASWWVRTLLVFFTVVMMFITSTGIFGFLSSGYQKAASQRSISQQRIENVKSKRQTFQSRANRLESTRKSLVDEQKSLRQLQREQGWLSERQDQRLSEIPGEINEVESRLTATRDSILSYEQRVTNLEAKSSEDAKLGPIVFVAETVGLDQDSAALYFILLLIFVFDPMAVTLVVALSMATGIEDIDVEAKEEMEGETSSSDSERSGRMDAQDRVRRMKEFASIGERDKDASMNVNVTVPEKESSEVETDDTDVMEEQNEQSEEIEDEGFKRWKEGVTKPHKKNSDWQDPFSET